MVYNGYPIFTTSSNTFGNYYNQYQYIYPTITYSGFSHVWPSNWGDRYIPSQEHFDIVLELVKEIFDKTEWVGNYNITSNRLASGLQSHIYVSAGDKCINIDINKDIIFMDFQLMYSSCHTTKFDLCTDDNIDKYVDEVNTGLQKVRESLHRFNTIYAANNTLLVNKITYSTISSGNYTI